jgi:hypothetical protein
MTNIPIGREGWMHAKQRVALAGDNAAVRCAEQPSRNYPIIYS